MVSPRTRLSLVTKTPAKSTSVSDNVLNISANFRKKIEMAPIGYSGDKGELIREKKLKLKISFPTTFKPKINFLLFCSKPAVIIGWLKVLLAISLLLCHVFLTLLAISLLLCHVFLTCLDLFRNIKKNIY